MIRTLGVVLTIGALGACAQAPAPAPAAQDTAAVEAKMRADLTAWFEHYNTGNADGIAAQYADEAILMPPNKPASVGRAAIRAFIAADTADTKAAGLTLKNNGVSGWGVSGDLAWMSGTFSVVDTKGTVVDTGKYLSVHRKTNGEWLYIRDTWNSDNPPPPPPPPVKK
jgi:ketosteroid isomerase-like protein